MSVRGIEFALGATVAQAEVSAAGYAFVVGHLGAGGGGYLTGERAKAYIDAGLSIVSIYDAPPQPAVGDAVGYDPRLFEDPAKVLQSLVYRSGITDGRSAYALARNVGQAAGSAIYFEVDADVSAGISYVLEYFRGIADGMAEASKGEAAYRVGVHGSGFVLDAVYGAGLADYKWLAAPSTWRGSAGYAAYDIIATDPGNSTGFAGVVASHSTAAETLPAGAIGQWGTTTSAPNLVIDDLNVRTLPLSAGDRATITFAIGNAGTEAAQASTARLLLSTDAAIGEEDTVLGRFDVPSLAARTAATDSLSWVVPDGMAPGTYYLGVAADPVAGESSTTDNVYAISFTVVGEPLAANNLVINDLTLGGAAVAAGGRQTILFEVGNAGPGPTAASTATLYLSTDSAISAADVFLGAFPISALAPGASVARSLTTTIPSGTGVGTYYIGVVASPVAGETSASDNAYAVSFAVTQEQAPAPNLVIDYLTVDAVPVAAGGVAMIDFAVGNAGQAGAGASTATVYLSSDADITAADTVLGRVELGALAAGTSSAQRLLATIPAGTAAGKYHVGVLADPVPGEPNIRDNGFAQPLSVVRMAGAVSIADVTVSEGNSGTVLASFIVTRTGGTAAFAVDYATADGGATLADGDYEAMSGTLVFDEGVVARTITVAVSGDLRDETRAVQDFFVNLSGATNGAAIADAQGRGSIIDDDRRNQAPEVAGRNLRVHVSQQGASASMVSSVADADGDAITEYAFRDTGAGGGFLRLGAVPVASGEWVTVAAAALGSLTYVGGAAEGAELIDVRVFDGQAWSAEAQLAATTIADIEDDYGSTAPTAGRISVGGAITGTIESAGDADWLAVALVAGRTYRFDLEGSGSGAGSLADPVLALRDDSGSSREIAADDNGGGGGNARLIHTATENGTLYVAAAGAGALTGTYRLSAAIVPNALLSLTASDARRPEGRAGATPFTFAVTRSGDLAGPSTASYAVAGSGRRPAFATDFAGEVFPSGTVTFLPGEASKVITIGVAGDTAVEETEAFTVTLASLSDDTVVETATAEALIRDDDTITDVVVVNTATSEQLAIEPVFYDGPVAGVEKEIILLTADNLNATVSGDSWFIRTGSGTDAVAVHGGRNVLDGGGGSNFLTGASGEDTFFLDARGAAAEIWSTVVGFGLGDSVTVWGISAENAAIAWADDLGAAGFTGLTLQAAAAGQPSARVTLVGYDRADLESGMLQVTSGSLGAASPYLHIQLAA